MHMQERSVLMVMQLYTSLLESMVRARSILQSWVSPAPRSMCPLSATCPRSRGAFPTQSAPPPPPEKDQMNLSGDSVFGSRAARRMRRRQDAAAPFAPNLLLGSNGSFFAAARAAAARRLDLGSPLKRFPLEDLLDLV